MRHHYASRNECRQLDWRCCSLVSETSGLSSDKDGQPLTYSWFPGGDGEKRSPVTATGAHIWPAMANAETNGETDNARNVGQMGTRGNGYAVNKLRGKHWGEFVSVLRPTGRETGWSCPWAERTGSGQW